jgi:homoserine kinase
MSVVSCVSITVPATTANLGPGFDCIGAALTLYNDFKFTRLDEGELTISVTGTEAARVITDGDNLAYQAFVKLYQHLNLTPPPVKIDIQLDVPWLGVWVVRRQQLSVGWLVQINWQDSL